MNNYYVREVLSKDKINLIQELLEHANKNNFWRDGLTSGGGMKSIKNNKELSDIEMSQTINSSIMDALDKDKNFLSFTAASTTHLNIISKSEFGSYYNPHCDQWCNGEFSTTVFLSDSNSYEGGELCLLFDNNEEKLFKLDAGWAVTYPTGTLHRVNKVLSGIRYVSVFWTKSFIKNPTIRNIYYQLSLIEELLEKNTDPMHHTDCMATLKDPLFIAGNLKNEILRHYGV